MNSRGKRKAENKIACVILLAGLLCTGCGRNVMPEDRGESAIEALPERGEEAYGAGMREKDDLTLQEELRPCILQIACGDYRGSGVVWEITEEEVTVVSSAHLLKNGETCEVLCPAGVYYEAKVERILENCDIGFAVFGADALKEDGVELTAAVPAVRDKEELVPGEELVIYGSMDFVAGDFVKGYLIEAETAMQLEGNEGEQPLMLGGIVREDAEAPEPDDAVRNAAPDGENGSTELENPPKDDAADRADDLRARSAVDAGMSGSGVFDREGKLLGILAGGDGESGFAAVPVWQITAG